MSKCKRIVMHLLRETGDGTVRVINFLLYVWLIFIMWPVWVHYGGPCDFHIHWYTIPGVLTHIAVAWWLDDYLDDNWYNIKRKIGCYDNDY